MVTICAQAALTLRSCCVKTPTLLVLLLIFVPVVRAAAVAERVILVTMDGVRCQEMFQGLDRDTWQAHNEGKDLTTTDLYRRFWAETPEERRAKVMPFFWNVLMRDHGAIAGNRFNGSVVKLTNRIRSSYPGYSEILTGAANDEVIRNNSKIQNPRATVLDFLRAERDLPRERVALFGSWDVFAWIASREAGGVTTNAGFKAYEHPDALIRHLSAMQFETPTPWNNVRHDHYTFRFAMAHLEMHRPVVLHLALGETDDWAHDRRYDRVLEALHRSDAYLRELWTWLQSQDDYRGKTTILFATDHGRGDFSANWMHHNGNLEGAAFVWLAAAGAGVKPRGEITPPAPLGNNQVAATLAWTLGHDYRASFPAAGPVLDIFFDAAP